MTQWKAQLQQSLAAIIGGVIFLAILILGIIFFSYLIIIVAAIGFIAFIIASVRRWIGAKIKANDPPGSRTIDHDPKD